MQQFILLRGHQGSGKTTFAHAQIAAFQKQYPDAHIVHIENDLLMTDENGEYRFSGQAVDAAQRKGLAMMQEACERGRANPHEHILIINSNTNQKSAACIHLLRLARKHKFAEKIYRLRDDEDDDDDWKGKGLGKKRRLFRRFFMVVFGCGKRRKH